MSHPPTTEPERVFHILWDNGTDACGEFHYNFSTEDEARAWGEVWLYDFKIDNNVQPDDLDQPHFDILEVTRGPSTDN